MRHSDHQFERTRAEFADWEEAVVSRCGYLPAQIPIAIVWTTEPLTAFTRDYEQGRFYRHVRDICTIRRAFADHMLSSSMARSFAGPSENGWTHRMDRPASASHPKEAVFSISLPDQVVHCLEMLSEQLSDSPLSECEVFVLSGDEAAPPSQTPLIASLCAHWSPSSNARLEVFRSTTHIRKHLRSTLDENISVPILTLEQTLEALTDSGFGDHYLDVESAVAIAIRGESISPRTLASLAACVVQIRHKSLNRRNAIYNSREVMVERLKPSFSASLRSFTALLAEHCWSKYSIPTAIAERYQTEDPWCLLPHSDSVNVSKDFSNHDSEEIKTLLRENERKLLFGKPLTGRLSTGRYFLMAPVERDSSKAPVRYAIITLSSHPIPHALPADLYTLSTAFSRPSFLQQQQLAVFRVLEDAKSSLTEAVHRAMSPGDVSLKYCAKLLFDKAFTSILGATSAHSASLRVFNPTTRSLESLALVEDEITRTVPQERTQAIPISDSSYVTARAWNQTSRIDGNDYVYENFLGSSTARNRQHRKETQSELCFPFYFKDIKIGTVNIESPDPDSLNLEIDYLQTVLNTVEGHLALLIDAHDAAWLSRRSELYHGVHKVLRIVESDAVDDRTAREIEQHIDIRTPPLAGRPRRLASLCQTVEQSIRDLKGRSGISTTPAEVARGVHVNIDDTGIVLKPHGFRLITMLVQNMLDNYVLWADKKIDTLLVNHSGAVNEPLLIYTKINSPLDKDLRENGFQSPLIKVDPAHPGFGRQQPRRQLRYGMFITGSLARHLSGYAQVSACENNVSGELRIQVPLTRLIQRD